VKVHGKISVFNFKNLFLNVNRQTEALTLVLSCGVEREKEDEKILTVPLTLPSPAEWKGNKEDVKI
jgi:hypothetical protein